MLVKASARTGTVPLTWQRPSQTVPADRCVEVAYVDHGVLLRVSEDGGRLGMSHREWAEFLAAVKAGKYDQRAR